MAAQKAPKIPWKVHYAIFKPAHGIHTQTAERIRRELVLYGAMVAHVSDDMVRERTIVRPTATSHHLSSLYTPRTRSWVLCCLSFTTWTWSSLLSSAQILSSSVPHISSERPTSSGSKQSAWNGPPSKFIVHAAFVMQLYKREDNYGGIGGDTMAPKNADGFLSSLDLG